MESKIHNTAVLSTPAVLFSPDPTACPADAAAAPGLPPVISHRPLPLLIQGGMGVGVSGWRLARAVAEAGQLGVVSGTSLDALLVRRLQDGDADGSIRRAAQAFPWPAWAERIVAKWWRPGGKPPATPYEVLPLLGHDARPEALATVVFAAFVEVWLAKAGHRGEIGINLLTKVQIPTVPTLYGAMLAGVGWVFMGAGIPRQVPPLLAALADHRPVQLSVELADGGPALSVPFDPASLGERPPAGLVVPRFVPIVSSHTLAQNLARKLSGQVAGFVVERHTAGGHNAPPRGRTEAADLESPRYGPRDEADLAALRELGLPFWLAGGRGEPGALAEALRQGATGVQVGTLFAFCREAGLTPALKRTVHDAVRAGRVQVLTDGRASPTGYPFKVVVADGLPAPDNSRARVCDLGYLRSPYRRDDGSIGYRCAAEPVASYLRKGGELADTVGRVCLCNALLANVGHAQRREGGREEPALLTAGDGLDAIGALLVDRDDYTAADVVRHLLGDSDLSACPAH